MFCGNASESVGGVSLAADECEMRMSPTVGLSLGITAKLSTASKLVVVVVMFLGRVGTLTILVAITRKTAERRYKYPEESVFIT